MADTNWSVPIEASVEDAPGQGDDEHALLLPGGPSALANIVATALTSSTCPDLVDAKAESTRHMGRDHVQVTPAAPISVADVDDFTDLVSLCSDGQCDVTASTSHDGQQVTHIDVFPRNSSRSLKSSVLSAVRSGAMRLSRRQPRRVRRQSRRVTPEGPSWETTMADPRASDPLDPTDGEESVGEARPWRRLFYRAKESFAGRFRVTVLTTLVVALIALVDKDMAQRVVLGIIMSVASFTGVAESLVCGTVKTQGIPRDMWDAVTALFSTIGGIIQCHPAMVLYLVLIVLTVRMCR